MCQDYDFCTINLVSLCPTIGVAISVCSTERDGLLFPSLYERDPFSFFDLWPSGMEGHVGMARDPASEATDEIPSRTRYELLTVSTGKAGSRAYRHKRSDNSAPVGRASSADAGVRECTVLAARNIDLLRYIGGWFDFPAKMRASTLSPDS